MALSEAHRRLTTFRIEGIEHIEAILHVIVNNRSEQPSEAQVVMLSDLVAWWENLSKRMAQNPTYWLQGLTEAEQTRLENARYLLDIVQRLYGPRAMEG